MLRRRSHLLDSDARAHTGTNVGDATSNASTDNKPNAKANVAACADTYAGTDACAGTCADRCADFAADADTDAKPYTKTNVAACTDAYSSTFLRAGALAITRTFIASPVPSANAAPFANTDVPTDAGGIAVRQHLSVLRLLMRRPLCRKQCHDSVRIHERLWIVSSRCVGW